MNDADYQKLRMLRRAAEAVLQQGNTRVADRQHAKQIKWLADLVYGLDEQAHNLREQTEEDHAITRDRLAKAWQEGFKQGGPMHDVNCDDPDAHTRNPYKEVA